MNKFKYYFILSITTLSLFSCSKNNDTPDITPPREYAVQYATDITDIEEYLKTNYITVVDHSGFVDDQDVTITKIPQGGTQQSIFSYLNSATYPKLLVREVSKGLLIHDVAYKIYYLVLRPGVGQSPSNVDGVLAAYHGEYLQRTVTTGTETALTSTFFEDVKYPQDFFNLYTIQPIPLRAWSEIFPQFKTGNYSSNADGTVTHTNFGAGVMFIPSGLGYYSSGSGSIPAYTPLVFSFKLFEIRRLDQDGDGIPSYLEDLNNDGYIYDYRNTAHYSSAAGVINPDDTDGDGIPDFADVDDDGDGYSTKNEIKNPATGLSYPFASIPSCDGGTTDPARLKKHLDKSCH
ncbi:FKBP-type peptidyl-prolyl cis-trans isomerase [Flavobacterium frigoris]|uniref:FKBP-type peptidyl-prolyl cis-trans isomerase FkpA n=1 Tax=Flavobacterium frigoris (strain PS1) TaxID=1086011 RepID=H7FLJ9_FLAFP|nr:hypothetical protein [Flavobacterium frigoris]EIA10541.1 FKBP-type peptidyl-prolyl cis-trans isomerase FkpA precursor [Flavobacterium frigoris PS1]